MMMGGMGAGFGLLMLLYALLALGLTLGFSYIIWILAMKETGYVRTTGLVIGWGVATLAVVLFLSGLIYGGKFAGRYGMGGVSGPTMMRKMMGSPEKEAEKYMREMMKTPHMRKWMKEYLQKERK